MKDLINKIIRSLGILRRVSHYVDQATRITLFNTLILPHIDYCSTVWCNNVTKTDINKLQRLQNVGMRIILQCEFRTRTKDMLDTLRWLSVAQRLQFNTCCLFWKMVNRMTPDYLSDLICHTDSIHDHNTRSAAKKNLFISQSHPKSLIGSGSETWNTVPAATRSLKDYFKFKKELISHIRDTVNHI